MAYCPRNKLAKVKQVQAIYRKYKEEGVTASFIYNQYIKDTFQISQRTYFNWLAINVKLELGKLAETPVAK